MAYKQQQVSVSKKKGLGRLKKQAKQKARYMPEKSVSYIKPEGKEGYKEVKKTDPMTVRKTKIKKSGRYKSKTITISAGKLISKKTVKTRPHVTKPTTKTKRGKRVERGTSDKFRQYGRGRTKGTSTGGKQLRRVKGTGDVYDPVIGGVKGKTTKYSEKEGREIPILTKRKDLRKRAATKEARWRYKDYTRPFFKPGHSAQRKELEQYPLKKTYKSGGSIENFRFGGKTSSQKSIYSGGGMTHNMAKGGKTTSRLKQIYDRFEKGAKWTASKSKSMGTGVGRSKAGQFVGRKAGQLGSKIIMKAAGKGLVKSAGKGYGKKRIAGMLAKQIGVRALGLASGFGAAILAGQAIGAGVRAIKRSRGRSKGGAFGQLD